MKRDQNCIRYKKKKKHIIYTNAFVHYIYILYNIMYASIQRQIQSIRSCYFYKTIGTQHIFYIGKLCTVSLPS